MFNTILTTIQPGGNTIQRVYEGKTDKDINGRSLYMIDNRNICTMNPRDIARHS